MQNELIKLINSSGLDANKSEILLNNFSDYFNIAQQWEEMAKNIIITDVSQVEEMKKAREGRLFLKEKRVLIEKTRKRLKESALREGQAIDSIAKILTNLITPIEDDLNNKERFIELMEIQRKKELKAERLNIIGPYVEFLTPGVIIEELNENDFNNLLSFLKHSLNEKIEKEKKEKAEKEAKEKQEAEERERIKKENEILKAAKEKAEKEKAEQEQKLKEEIKKAELLQAELKAKREKEEQEKKAAEKLAKQAERAPDKTKLLNLADQIKNFNLPELKSEEAKYILNNVSILLEKTSNYIIEKSNNI